MFAKIKKNNIQGQKYTSLQGQIHDFWKGGSIYKGVGFALLIFFLSHFALISNENEIIWSH